MTMVLLALMVVSIGFLSGCAEHSKFEGNWKNNFGITVYTFRSDGTYEGTYTEGTYEITDGKLICESDTGYTVSYYYSFSNDGNTLMLDGIGTSSYTLTKEE